MTIYRNFMRIKKQEIHRIGQDENTAEMTCSLSKSFFMSLIYPIVLDIIKTTKRRGTLFVTFCKQSQKSPKFSCSPVLYSAIMRGYRSFFNLQTNINNKKERFVCKQ